MKLPEKNDKLTPTRRIENKETMEETPQVRSTGEQEKQTSDQEPFKNFTKTNLEKETSDQDKTLADIAERISMAETAALQEEEEIKKGRKRKEVLETGKVFQGKYEVVKMIGSGGMGQVYLANHIALGNKIAIKVLNTNLIAEDDEEAIDRFKREARATASVDHPNAVKVFDFGAEDNICYLIMEFLNGESLRRRLIKTKRLPISQVASLVEQVCDVLDVMHRKGIVHRDLKPDNIFFHNQENREVVKVLDFGIAKVAGSTMVEGKLTNTGALLGTPHYMSPEQCQGMVLDSRSDLYSFGIIVYELLAGTLPFQAENTLSMLFKHVRDIPTPINKIVPNLDPTVADVIMKALEKYPKNRYQTAKEYSQAFCDAVQNSKLPSFAANNSTSIKVREQKNFDINENVETEMFSDKENAVEEIKNIDNKLYDVSTRSHQASATRPVGRFVDQDKEELLKPSNNVLPSNAQEKISYPMPLSKNNNLAKYVIPISGLVLLVILLGVWKQMPISQQSLLSTPSIAPTNISNQPTEKELLSKDSFILIPASTAIIGTDGKKCDYVPGCKIEEYEKPAHKVSLRSYYISKYEVTNAEYYEFIKETGHNIPTGWNVETKTFLDGTDKVPVNYVSWEDAQAYCRWRKKKTGIEFRLPTEEEWEHAARGDGDSLFPWGDDWDPSFVYAAKSADRVKNPASVEFPPNNTSDRSRLGVFAMAGNVAEWTNSKFDTYPDSPYAKKVKEKERNNYVVKGGSFNAEPNFLRVTSRVYYKPEEKDSNVGFRLVVTPK